MIQPIFFKPEKDRIFLVASIKEVNTISKNHKSNKEKGNKREWKHGELCTIIKYLKTH